MSKQRRDDKPHVAEVVARHTMMGTEQAARFVEGCSYFLHTCECLGLSPEHEIYAMADRIPIYYPIRAQATSYATFYSDLDDLAACAANPAMLRMRVNEFMEVDE